VHKDGKEMANFIKRTIDDLIGLQLFIDINGIDESVYAEHIQNIHLIIEDMKTIIKNEVKP
jgi:hypothetical protein